MDADGISTAKREPGNRQATFSLPLGISIEPKTTSITQSLDISRVFPAANSYHWQISTCTSSQTQSNSNHVKEIGEIKALDASMQPCPHARIPRTGSPFHPAVAIISDMLQRASRLTSHGDAHQNDRGKRKEKKGNGSRGGWGKWHT